VFDDEIRAKPLRIILGVLANPFIRLLSERPNERKCSLWQNPDVGFAGGRFIAYRLCLRMVALA
jgi:hypothetical protein